MTEKQYLIEKRIQVLKEIKPICEAYGISEYDYIIKEKGQKETLVLDGTKIACSCNSISAIIQELTGYLFISTWRQRSLGAFETQVKNIIKRYWI
jgi:hypothetical protein